MERLTEECWKNLDPWECCGQDHYCTRGCHDSGGCTNRCIVPKLYARLAKYEDTGLEPGEFFSGLEVAKILAALEELKKFKQAESAGCLLTVPCKRGDDIYFILEDASGYLGYCVSEPHKITEVGSRGFWTSGLVDEADRMDDFTSWSELGKTAFLSFQEAEKALDSYTTQGEAQP